MPRRFTGLARHLGRDRRIAVSIAADPRAEHDRRRVHRQRPPGQAAEHAIQFARVARHGVPQRLLEDEEPAAHFLHRRRPLRPHVVCLHIVRISRRRSSAISSRSPAVRSGRSWASSDRAMRTCSAASVRRVMAVGCAVSTSSIRIRVTVSQRGPARRPAARVAAAPRRTSLLARRRPGRGGSRASGGCGDAVPRCWRGTESARTLARPEPRGRAAARATAVRGRAAGDPLARLLGNAADAFDGGEQLRRAARA